MSSRTAALNPSVWNAGTATDRHPLDMFWAERFLVYPNDLTSGPLRDGKCHADKATNLSQPQTDIVQRGESPSCSSYDSPTGERPLPKFSMDALSGAWIPYGGGQRMCPGRHFAKLEIIGTFALLIDKYDIELTMPKEWQPEMDMRYFPLGGLPIKGGVRFKIRRSQQ